MVERKNKKTTANILLYSSIAFIVIWISAGSYFQFGDKMPYWVGMSNRNDELALILQIFPLIVASFIVSFSVLSKLKVQVLFRYLIIVLFGSVLSYLAWYWYILAQF